MEWAPVALQGITSWLSCVPVVESYCMLSASHVNKTHVDSAAIPAIFFGSLFALFFFCCLGDALL
jgi:hypothetical protein